MQTRKAERGPGRPRDERVTGAALGAVIELMTEQGIGAVTMDAVAARAGVSKPALYRRWPTKQALITAAAETRIGELSVPELGDFRAELREVLNARLAAYRQPGTDRLLAELIAAAMNNDEQHRAHAEFADRMMGETRAILERGIARGEIRADIDVRSTATLVAAPLICRLLVECRPPDERLVDDVIDLVAHAVGC